MESKSAVGTTRDHSLGSGPCLLVELCESGDLDAIHNVLVHGERPLFFSWGSKQGSYSYNTTEYVVFISNPLIFARKGLYDSRPVECPSPHQRTRSSETLGLRRGAGAHAIS